GSQPADSRRNMFTARGFHKNEHVLFRLARHHAQKSWHFGFEKAAVEGKVAALVNRRRRQRRSGVRNWSGRRSLVYFVLVGNDMLRLVFFGQLLRLRFLFHAGETPRQAEKHRWTENGNNRSGTANGRGWIILEDGDFKGSVEICQVNNHKQHNA